MQWPSPAKLNLFLYVTGVRADGYHYLQTLFQFLDYSDTLTITVRRDRQIRLFNCTAQIPTEHNLIIRAARLLQHYSGCQLGADISVDKRLPIGAGLGGGSSNAATTLAVLNHLWQCALTPETLRKLALKVGADVPVFLYGQAAFAEGIGERLQLAHPLERWYLVAHPGVSISTAALFNDPALRSNTPRRSLEKLLTLPYQNDFEPIARKNVYKVELLISWLLNYAPTRLTGSGSAVFAEFDTQDAANAVCYKLPSWAQGFVARGVNSSPLQRALSECYSYA